MKYLILLFVLIPGLALSSFAKTNTDSLKAVLESAPAKEKINIYEQIIKASTSSNPEDAITYSKLLIAFADSSNNNETLALGYRLLAKVYEYQHRYDLSLDIWKKNLEIEKKLKNLKNQAYTSIAIGGSLQQISRYDEALYYFGEAQKILEEINDQRGLIFNYSNIGLTYEKKGMLPKALEYKIKALQNAENLADSSNIAYSLGSIAACQTNLKDYQQAIDNYTRAIEIYESIGKTHNAVHTLANLGVAYNSIGQNQKAMESFRKGMALSKSINYNYGEAIVQMNLGEVLLKNNEPDSAMYYLNASNHTFSELNDPHPLCYNSKLMGSYYLKAGDYQKAIDYLLETYNLSHTIQAPDMHRDAAELLSETYEQWGRPDLALQYFKTFKHYSDSLFNAEIIAETTRLEEQYHFDKETQKTLLLHQAQLSKKQVVLLALISGLIVVSILLLLLFIEYRRKNAAYKSLYQKNMETIKFSEARTKKEVLKNGELFQLIEQKMQEAELYKIKNLNRELLAEKLGSNYDYIQKAIKDHAGKTISEYITFFRINKSMKLITDKEYLKKNSLSAVPSEIGMTQSTFYRAFKEIAGMTPSQFQKLSKK